MFLFCFRALFFRIFEFKNNVLRFFFVSLFSSLHSFSVAFSPKDRSSQRSTTRFVHAGHAAIRVSPQLLLPGIQADRTLGNTLLFVRCNQNEEKTAQFLKGKKGFKQFLHFMQSKFCVIFHTSIFYHILLECFIMFHSYLNPKDADS